MKKNRLISLSLRCFLPAFLLATSVPSLLAETRYYDRNGSEGGFGLTSGNPDPYIWNTTDVFWNTSTTGTGLDFTPWTDGDIAYFQGPTGQPASGGFDQNSTVTVKLNQSMILGGLKVGSNGRWYFETDSPITLTLNAGAELYAQGGTVATGIFLGDNINVVGNFTVATVGTTRVRIQGTGNAYQGTITVAGAGNEKGGFVLANSRVIAEYEDTQEIPTRGNTKFIVNSGLLDIGTDGGNMTIKGLSGAGGGTIGTRGRLIIDQADNTEWGGAFFNGDSNPWSDLTKTGAGRLSLTNADAVHRFGGTSATAADIDIDAGSLYVAGTITKTTSYSGAFTASDRINVAAGATFGGTAKVDKRLVLAAATSILNPGMYNEAENRHDAGVLELQYHVIADNGGTFNFHLGGDDGEGNLLNSSILVSGNIDTPITLTLGGIKTVNLYDLGLQSLEFNTAYILFDASATGIARTEGWDEGWILGTNATGLAIGSFGFNEDHQLTVTFIPEPSSLLFVVTAGLGALWVRNRRRR